MRLMMFAIALPVLALGSTASGQAAHMPLDRLVTITVAEDRHYTLAHEIVIEPDEPFTVRTEEQLEGRVWRATRTSERGVEAARSDTCPALRRLALSFADLPDLPTPDGGTTPFRP